MGLMERVRSWLPRRGGAGGRAVTEGSRSAGAIRVQVHDKEALDRMARDVYGEPYDQLCRTEKADLARLAPPDEEYTHGNVTCDGYHEYVVDELNPESTATDLDASHLALGDDDSTTPAHADTSLNNEVHRAAFTDAEDRGRDLFVSTFFDTGEANGNTIKEVGLVTASSGGTLLNHALITHIDKTNKKTMTIDVTLEERAA